MIVFDKVCKAYQNTKIINGISFTIEDGTLVALIGESGCGKTTTLKMINKLITITSGTITINGKDVNDLNEIDLRRNMGYVIQSTGLFPHMTIRENIELISKLQKIDYQKIASKTKEMVKMAYIH